MQGLYWFLTIAVSVAAGYFVYRADVKRVAPMPWLTSVLRGLLVFCTLLLILIPTITITKNVVEKPIVLLLQDDSRSIGNALGADSANYRKTMQPLTGKLSAQYKVVQWGFGNTVTQDSVFQYGQPATDIAAALSRAQEFYGAQNLGAVVLASDGLFNEGANPLFQELALHCPLYSVAIGDSSHPKDIRVTAAYANKVVTINTSFEVRADIVAERCEGYNNAVEIKEGGEVLATAPLAVNTARYDHSVSFTVKAAKAGLHHYIIDAPVADGEQNTVNNRRDLFVEVVEEKKNVLIVSAAPHPDVNAIKEALAGIESYKVTVVSADNMPSSFSGYNVIILHGLPSARNNIAPQVLAAHKPLWIIVSNQTNSTAFNSLQELTHTTVTPSPPHDVVGEVNPAFNSFTLPQSIASVSDKMPPLSAPLVNVATAPGASVLFRQRGDAAMPLWILQQGTVPTAVLAGENLWRWRLHEYKNFSQHSVIDECIRQTVAFLAANTNEKPFTVSLPKYVWSGQEPIVLNATLLNASNEQVNEPDVQLTITDSGGHSQQYSFERAGNAYSLNIGIWAGGTYNYAAHATYNGKAYSATGSFAVENIPLELLATAADYPLLYGLARKYGGGFVTAANAGSLYDSIAHNDRVKPVILTNVETVPLVDRRWYFFVILLIGVTEWLLRKYWLAQ